MCYRSKSRRFINSDIYERLLTEHLAPSQTLENKETNRLLWLFRETRARTMSIVSTLEPDDFVVQTAFFTSPAKWHIGHVSWIYEAIMGKIDDTYGFKEDEMSAYLNSYYQQFGVPHDKGRRGNASRPTTRQMFEYFEDVSDKVERFIATKAKQINAADVGNDSGAPEDTIRRLLEMGIHHECQHQELLVYDLQHMLADKYFPVGGIRETPRPVANATYGSNDDCNTTDITEQSCNIEGGKYMMGYVGDNYCYDIELPEHPTYVGPYTIDKYPVTNGQYMEFIKDGGYKSYKYWLSDGWEKVKENGWEAPMYWEQDEDNSEAEWYIYDFAGFRQINPREPIAHISYYEADAYCKWAGKRLPTEAEWEMAACWNGNTKSVYPWGDDAPTPERCNLLESGHWRCAEVGAYPDGASPCGCQQMLGDVWEWTASEFAGYPGFKSEFDEYNDKWFANQKVLRGGSFGTPAMSIRASYRNFFRLDERWMIAGFRCAQNAESVH